MLCRLKTLGVDNYMIVAFDATLCQFCRLHNLPCVPASMEYWWASHSNPSDQFWNSSHHTFDFYTEGFHKVSKLKCQQVLRALRAGYDVLWSDMDIFWEKNPIPSLLADIRRTKADIAIQSDATLVQNPTSEINSGFYYVAHSRQSIATFEQIVHHASLHPELSEQRSFNEILCGGKREVNDNLCHNENTNTTTYVLDRDVYVNGYYEQKFQNIDKAMIIHFNWRVGLANKTHGFKRRGKWLLNEKTRSCII